jgi:Sulfotransferase family
MNVGWDNEEYKLKRFTLLFIYGSGRCGSTILDLLLNGHSQITGLGEIATLMTITNPLQLPDRLSVNFGKDYIEFWSKVKDYYGTVYGEEFEQINLGHPRWRTIITSWKAEDVQKWVHSRAMLLSCIHQISGAPILVDASKVHHQLYLLYISRLFNIKVIHLIRDGRAVANSYIRRYNNFTGGIYLWTIINILSLWLRKKLGKENWLQIKYEDLATKPDEILKRICRFLGVSFESGMLRYRSHPYFGIGGNPNVKDTNEEAILLDERWRQELSWGHRLAFALMAGWLNKLYGYGII